MAGKVLNKMMSLIGLEDEIEEFEEEADEMEDGMSPNDNRKEEYEPIISSNSKKQNKIVSIHTSVNTKVLIVKPSTYDEVVDICDHLKNRKIVVVNSTGLEPKVGQRLLDFMSGATYALGGNLEEVGCKIYIVSPSNVEVDSELKNELSNKGIFSWNK
ncbi:cell division inhibitor SepF [Clostridium pascui]|uniref:cell division protein SepF n=1 Tax=Clostridium pascui TaxID=46609 RepID=UPI00195A4FBA|nr:cell division protein SepF [Clostridium pascui]MBM7869360.1 cell division inhibitor SepF [Clostridium pascui]